MSGRYPKGETCHPRGKLSNILKRIWGAPEVCKSESTARDGIGRRTGVVSFFRIHGGGPADGGHIDLIWPTQSRFSECAIVMLLRCSRDSVLAASLDLVSRAIEKVGNGSEQFERIFPNWGIFCI